MITVGYADDDDGVGKQSKLQEIRNGASSNCTPDVHRTISGSSLHINRNALYTHPVPKGNVSTTKCMVTTIHHFAESDLRG